VGSKDRICGELRVFFCVRIPDSSEVHLYSHFHENLSQKRQSQVLTIDANGMFRKHKPNMAYAKQLGSKDNIYGELRLFFYLFIPDSSEVHL